MGEAWKRFYGMNENNLGYTELRFLDNLGPGPVPIEINGAKRLPWIATSPLPKVSPGIQWDFLPAKQACGRSPERNRCRPFKAGSTLCPTPRTYQLPSHIGRSHDMRGGVTARQRQWRGRVGANVELPTPIPTAGM